MRSRDGDACWNALDTHRLSGLFHVRGLENTGGCEAWCVGSVEAWISGPVVQHPNLSGAPSTDRAPLWSTKGRASMFM